MRIELIRDMRRVGAGFASHKNLGPQRAQGYTEETGGQFSIASGQFSVLTTGH
jgi:hypothetical protein